MGNKIENLEIHYGKSAKSDEVKNRARQIPLLKRNNKVK